MNDEAVAGIVDVRDNRVDYSFFVEGSQCRHTANILEIGIDSQGKQSIDFGNAPHGSCQHEGYVRSLIRLLLQI